MTGDIDVDAEIRRVAKERGWKVDYGPLSRDMGGKLQLWKGNRCLWRETPTLWIAADWGLTDQGSKYAWRGHQEYESFEHAMMYETD